MPPDIFPAEPADPKRGVQHKPEKIFDQEKENVEEKLLGSSRLGDTNRTVFEKLCGEGELVAGGRKRKLDKGAGC